MSPAAGFRVGTILASAVLVAGVGCASYTAPAYVEGPAVVQYDDADLVYTQDLPVVDIESYPSASYGGVDVYYVSGRWYRRGPRGWAYYRQEPNELGREREEHWQHDHDQRWAQPQAQPQTEHRGPEEHGGQRPGVTEAQPAYPRAEPVQPHREDARPAQPHREDARPAQPHGEDARPAQPHRDEMPAPPARNAQSRPREAPPQPAPRPPAHGAHAPAPAPEQHR